MNLQQRCVPQLNIACFQIRPKSVNGFSLCFRSRLFGLIWSCPKKTIKVNTLDFVGELTNLVVSKVLGDFQEKILGHFVLNESYLIAKCQVEYFKRNFRSTCSLLLISISWYNNLLKSSLVKVHQQKLKTTNI